MIIETLEEGNVNTMHALVIKSHVHHLSEKKK